MHLLLSKEEWIRHDVCQAQEVHKQAELQAARRLFGSNSLTATSLVVGKRALLIPTAIYECFHSGDLMFFRFSVGMAKLLETSSRDDVKWRHRRA